MSMGGGRRAIRSAAIAIVVALALVLLAPPASAREVEGTATVTLDGTVTRITESRATGTAEFDGTTKGGKPISGSGTLVLSGKRVDEDTFKVSSVKVSFEGELGVTEMTGVARAQLAKTKRVGIGDVRLALKGRGVAHFTGCFVGGCDDGVGI